MVKNTDRYENEYNQMCKKIQMKLKHEKISKVFFHSAVFPELVHCKFSNSVVFIISTKVKEGVSWISKIEVCQNDQFTSHP